MHDEIGAMVCLKDRKRIFLSSPGKMPHTKLSGRMFDIDMLSFFPICKILVWLMALYMTELWCPIVHGLENAEFPMQQMQCMTMQQMQSVQRV
jgi:hypothetical protein